VRAAKRATKKAVVPKSIRKAERRMKRAVHPVDTVRLKVEDAAVRAAKWKPRKRRVGGKSPLQLGGAGSRGRTA
jgi:hypothetical protein